MSTASDSESLCYRFSPTKEEIIRCLLRPAINGEPLSSAVVIEVDIYGENKEPWNIFDKAAQNSFWIVTRLKKKNKSRFNRTAGCGCWLAQSNKEIKNAQDQLIGFDKYFTFTCKKDQSSQGNGHWIMHEYSLSDKGLEDYVICEIKNKDSAVAVCLNHQEDEDTKNKKRKALDVVDQDMSVPSLKKVCADGLNATIDQQNSGELDLRHTMTNISPPEDNYGSVNWVDEVLASDDPSLPAISTSIDQSQGSFCIYQEIINCNPASTRNDQSTDYGELDHRQTTHEDTEIFQQDTDDFADLLNGVLPSNLWEFID